MNGLLVINACQGEKVGGGKGNQMEKRENRGRGKRDGVRKQSAVKTSNIVSSGERGQATNLR